MVPHPLLCPVHPAVRVVLWLLAVSLVGAGWADTAIATEKGSTALNEAQSAFEQKQYDRVLALVGPLLADNGMAPDARRLKVRALVKLGKPKEALAEYERLEARLGKEDPGVLREVAFGFITVLLTDMREQMRGASYTALRELESDETVPYFEDGLSDGSGLVRALATEGLGHLTAGRRSPRFAKMLADQAAIVRMAALKAMGRSGDRTFIPMIEQAVKDDQTSVRITAWGALAMLGQAGAWDKVREGAAVKNPEDRGIALKMLGALRDRRALPVLEEALADPQPSIRGAAAMACGDLGAGEAVPALIKLMADPLPPVRVSAALSLGELESADAVPALTKGLHDANAGARAAVASALLQLGRPFGEVEDTVRELTRHTDPGVRASAARAVAKTRGAAVRDAEGILRMLLTDPLPRPRIAAARVLGHTGGDQARGLLKQTLRDNDDAVRATAAGSLIRLMDATRSARKHDRN